jgi:putative ABC transport system permease protein
MNYFIFILKGAFFDFSRNKGRTLLTSLGILIGVLSVVLLIAFGLGLKKYIQDQFNSLGSNILRVVPGKILQGGSFRSGASQLGSVSFYEKDLLRLKRLKDVEFVIPVYSKTIKASANGQNEVGDLYSTSQDIFDGLNLAADQGRLFYKTDVDKHSKVVVLGPKIAEKIYGSSLDAVGKNIKIEGQSFKVIGVLKAKGGGGFGGVL